MIMDIMEIMEIMDIMEIVEVIEIVKIIEDNFLIEYEKTRYSEMNETYKSTHAQNYLKLGRSTSFYKTIRRVGSKGSSKSRKSEHHEMVTLEPKNVEAQEGPNENVDSQV